MTVGDLLSESELMPFKSKKTTPPNAHDLVAVEEHNGYRIYEIERRREDGKYIILGYYLAARFLANESEFIRIKNNSPKVELAPRIVIPGDRILNNELDQFVSRAKKELKKGDRVAVEHDHKHHAVREIEDVGEVTYRIGHRNYPLDKVKILKNNPPKNENRKKAESSIQQVPIKVNEIFSDFDDILLDSKSTPKVGDLVGAEIPDSYS